MPPIQKKGSLVAEAQRVRGNETAGGTDLLSQVGSKLYDIGKSSLEQSWKQYEQDTKTSQIALAALRRLKAQQEAEAAKQQSTTVSSAVSGAAAVPPPAPVSAETEFPSVEDTGTASGSEEQQDIQAQQYEAAQRAAPTEFRGGLTDIGESLKRTGGFFAGVGEYLYEASPLAPEPKQPPLSGLDVGQTESPEAYASRKAKDEADRQAFEAVRKNPNAGFFDKMKATPKFRELKQAQQERLNKYSDDGAFMGAMSAFMHDAGDLIMFLPNVLTAPIATFEAPKGATSEEVGEKMGRELLPTMATGMAAQLPGVDLVDQFKAAPLSTALTYLPAFSAGAKATKAGALKFDAGLKAAKWIEDLDVIDRASELWRGKVQANVSELADKLAAKIGSSDRAATSQWIMDRFYNKDPAITALMEEAFSESEGSAKAMQKLTDMYGRSQLEAKSGKRAASIVPTQNFVTSEMANIAENSGLSPKGIGQGYIKDMLDRALDIRFIKPEELGAELSLLTDQNGNKLAPKTIRQAVEIFKTLASEYDETAQTAKIEKEVQKMKAQMTAAGNTTQEINDAVSLYRATNRKEGALTWKILQDTLADEKKFNNIITAALARDPQMDFFRAIAGVDERSKLQRAFDTLRTNGFLDRTIENVKKTEPKRVQASFQRIGDELKSAVQERKIASVLEAEGNRFKGTEEWLASRAKTLPSVLNMTEGQLGETIAQVEGYLAGGSVNAKEAASLQSLLGHLKKMVPLTTEQGTKMVIRPLAFLQEQQAANKAFMSATSDITRGINNFGKANSLTLNPKAIISNIIGNISNSAMKFGTSPLSEIAAIDKSAGNYKKFLTDPMSVPEAQRRSIAAAVKTGLFDVDRITADANLYSSATGTTIPVVGPLYELSKKVGGKAMKWGDEAPKLRLFENKFNELDTYASQLQTGESLSYPTGPNTKMTITKLPDGSYQVGRKVLGQKQAYKTVTVADATDAVAEGAKFAATELVFDYSRVPGYMESLRRTALVGAASPFSTYAHKAFAFPGIKGGIVSPILSTLDGVSSTSSRVNAELAMKGLELAGRRAVITSLAKADKNDPDMQRLFAFDPSMTPAMRVAGPTTDNATAMVQQFSSSNWLDGTLSALQLVQSGVDTYKDINGTSAQQKFANKAFDPKYQKAIEDGDEKLLEDKKKAYYAAMAEVQDRATRPEALPNIMKLFGLGGTIFFDAFSEVSNAIETGKVSNGTAAVYNMLVPAYLRSALETAEVATDIPLAGGKGQAKMAAGIPEGKSVEDIYNLPALAYFLGNFTGLQAMAVDTEKKADQVAKKFKKEMEGRLSVWSKSKEAEMKLKFGDKEGMVQAERQAEYLKELVDEAIGQWMDGLYQKGIVGRKKVEEYLPPATEEETAPAPEAPEEPLPSEQEVPAEEQPAEEE